MARTLEEIREDALALPPEQMEELAISLQDKLHGTDPDIAASWNAEAERRWKEIESGKVETRSWDDTLADLEREFGV